jgi:hypothetical protein
VTEDTFREVATIAWVAFGLGATLLLSLLAVIGSWRLFRHASDSMTASTRATLAMEDLSRQLAIQASEPPPQPVQAGFGDLRQQAEDLIGRQARLQELTRSLLETTAMAGGRGPEMEELEQSLGRLEATVGQMAAALANLVQQLEQQEDGR